jgi:hypothetical protein
MGARRMRVVVLLLFPVLGIVALINAGQAQKSGENFSPGIPRTWEEAAIASVELPLASTGVPPEHISGDYYYRMPVRPIYKSYPIYAPGKEPRGYFERLKQLEPEIVFDPAKLKTEADWIKAGELAFDAPIAYDADPNAGIVLLSDVRNPAWYQQVGVRLTNDGVMPYARYVIRKKGTVEVGDLSCGMCHTRVMADGSIIKGAQGNVPFDRAIAFWLRTFPLPEQQRLESERDGMQLLFATPWLRPDPLARIGQMSLDELISVEEAIPPGVIARHGSSPFYPVQVPDLIGIRDRRYLDRTGLVRHRDIGDLMRYGALNQGADLLSRNGGFRPVGDTLPEPTDPTMRGRYSDEQLYALARYLYSLTPPPNPNRFDVLAARGQKVFEREGCTGCHTPPLYTNNRLTPAVGFTPPADHTAKFDILNVSVGTDPNLALRTRRGTGYYKVPSLKGVWYRGPFEHNGSVMTLEDWFDPRRLRDDYVPTGFKGYAIETRAVKGHEFGLKLSAEDKRALIAFLKTL